MKAKYMNTSRILFICMLFAISTNAQKSITILLNSQKVTAQVQNSQIVSVNKSVSMELLNAIQFPVVKDANYYRELNDIIAGKYGSYYADIVKKELLAIQSGKIEPVKDKLPRTTTLSINDVTVSFIKNTARLLGESSEQLVNLTDKLRSLNINYIMLEGHKPTNNINDYILTTNRVNTCKDYLIFKGIDPKKIKTKILLSTSDKKESESVRIVVK